MCHGFLTHHPIAHHRGHQMALVHLLGMTGLGVFEMRQCGDTCRSRILAFGKSSGLPPPCAGCCMRGRRHGLCRKRPRSSLARIHQSWHAQSHGQRCRTLGICETRCARKAWGYGDRPAHQTGQIKQSLIVLGYRHSHFTSMIWFPRTVAGRVGNCLMSTSDAERGAHFLTHSDCSCALLVTIPCSRSLTFNRANKPAPTKKTNALSAAIFCIFILFVSPRENIFWVLCWRYE